MRAEELLTEIEPLPFKARCRRLADLRGLSGDPALAALLDELSRRGHYERSLALFVAAAARDEASVAHLVRATGDPDAGLACRAIRLAVRYGAAPGAFLDGLEDAPAAVRAALYEAVRKYRRGDLADALVSRVADRWGDQEAATLLPACAAPAVAERLDGLAHAVGNWAALGRAHPDAVLGHAERSLAELPEAARNAWWFHHAPGVAAALRHDPGRVVRLLERHCRTRPLPRPLHPAAGALLDAEPERMLALLLSDSHRADLGVLLHRRSVRDRFARLGDRDMAAVARAVREDAGALRRLLAAFPPSCREAVFEAAMRGVDRGAAELDEDLLEVLPRALRYREARRMMGLRKVAETPSRTWAMAAFLPYEEALPILGELTRRPDADERATGYALLIRCAGRSGDPAVLGAALESLARLRNEQDPVRLSALYALTSVPEGLLRAGPAAAAGRLADDALKARDTSHQTRHQIGRIAAALCRQGAVHDDAELLVSGLEMVDRVAGSTGSLALGGLDRVLRRGQEHLLAAMLAPRLEAGARRDDHRLALLAARALRRRAHRVPVLQDALEAALDARDDGVLTQAITLWLAAPGTRAERAGRVVARDPSSVAVPAVLAAIARERTDLLDLVLAGSTPAGRFRRPDVTYVPRIVPAWADRWTARQRDAYRALLERVAADGEAPATDRAAAVSALARIPGTEASRLRPYFESGDPYIRRIALTVLPWTRSPQEVLPELLARAESDDAHVAVYAAARAARFVPPSALSAMLRPVLADGKITARKEAARILLRNRVPDAMDALAAAWDDPGQHRDVRAAIASAVRDRLDEPVARRILAEAAEGPRDLARQVLGTPPVYVEERFRSRYAALVLRVARSADPEARAAALPAVATWAPWAPEAPALLAGLVTDLDETRAWRDAVHALVRCVTTGIGAAELGGAAAGLAAAPAVPDAEPERDLPAFQRLVALAEAVRDASARHRTLGERAVQAVEGRLPEPVATELAAAVLRWDGPGAAGEIDALAGRCAGLGVLAVLDVADALATGPSEYTEHARPAPEEAHPHAARLAARGDLAGGLFACALTERHGPRAGWSADWRDLLRGLRAHAVPDVVHQALRIHTADE
ncbi:hypothetical protein [Actinomadura livida]|uniref:Thioredoxin-like negative regulator of GroEL n=1 Tax=Actinomadura livida TaxID=79909 RepID=A0A7W7MX27_9ACTN|nr:MULTISPECIES: hypothetical protein [Actinomadura]MBB4774321.1 thioredoxin-like negative regulator of GroEL [Actinomadura catellatispora]GGT83405.1 hypothetical protein GCM10010208_02280 [Actinomadura livida]